AEKPALGSRLPRPPRDSGSLAAVRFVGENDGLFVFGREVSSDAGGRALTAIIDDEQLGREGEGRAKIADVGEGRRKLAAAIPGRDDDGQEWTGRLRPPQPVTGSDLSFNKCHSLCVINVLKAANVTPEHISPPLQ